MATRLVTERSQRQVIRFDVLPDDVLLDIFDFYTNPSDSRSPYFSRAIEAWQTLIHVCRRWRSLVFRSPRRLNLRLFCTPERRIMETLDVWPALPLIVQGGMTSLSSTDNIIAALGHTNRVREITLWALTDRQFEGLSAAMQVPFPELTDIHISSYDISPYDLTPSVIPDSFLGGSVPSLRCFALQSISFPGLPNLLLSSTHLVKLLLTDIPHSWNISPEAIVAILSTLSSLQCFSLEFSPQPRPDWETRHPHLYKRSILPALENFKFKGVAEYLEDLVPLIDTPQLNSLDITFLNELDFDIQQLAHFIDWTPRLSERDEAHVEFNDQDARILFGTKISIKCSDPDQQLSFVSLNGGVSIVSTVKSIYIERGVLRLYGKNDTIKNALWLQLLAPFSAVKNLFLHKEFAPGIASALKELVGGRITEVLPSLQNIFVEDLASFKKSSAQFVVSRELSGHPVAIFDWDKESASSRCKEKQRLHVAQLDSPVLLLHFFS